MSAAFVLSAFADEIDWNLQVQIDVLQQYGINHIEMRFVNGKNLVDHTITEAKAIKKQLDAANFKLSAIGSPIGKQGITEKFGPHLDLFKHTLDLAHLLEAPYIRMFSFYIPRGEDPKEYRSAVIDRWEQFIEAAEGSGITLLHENEGGIYGDTAERCLDLLTTLNCDYVKAIFDPANFIQSREETYPKAWNMLKDYVVYMHIKDAKAADGQVVPAGHGDGRLKEILTELAQERPGCFLSLEPHLNNYQGPAVVEAGTPGFDLPEGNQKKFALAYQELNKLIQQI